MQNKEWNNVFDGNPAKWAELRSLEEQKEISKLHEMMNHNKVVKKITEDSELKSKDEVKEEIRQEIEKNEVEIPEAKRKEMDIFIKSLQDKGLSKRNIRRAFERKFNVKII